MSACKAGCGAGLPDGAAICEVCVVRWQTSPEMARLKATPSGEHERMDVAFVDFCSRVRAERLSALQGTWPAVAKEKQ